MFRTSARARAATTGTFVAVAILAGACSSSGTESESAPSALPVSVETDGLSVTVDDVVSAVATSSRNGDATVLTSPTTLDAQITVADEALPDEVSGDEITATVLSFDSEVDGASAITFELGPDGAEFDEPVLLEWEGPWAPNAAYSLAAFHGDGTPVEDTGSTDANSIAALRVEPTSDTTARYTLPVDHFSTWSVFVYVFDSPGTVFFTQFSGPTDFRGVVGEDAAAAVEVLAGGVETLRDVQRPFFRICASGRVVSTDGPVSASFDRSEPECVQVYDEDFSVQNFGLTLRCSAAGAASVDVAAYSLVVTERNPAGYVESGPKKTAELKGMMLRYSFDLKQQTGGGASARISDGTYRGGMLAAQTTLSVTCEEPQSTSTSSTTSTTTTTLDTTTTNSSTTTTTKPATTTSTTSIDTVPATPTTTGGTPSVTRPTTAPPTSAAPVTSAAPTTTAPPTSTPGTTPPPTSWGPAGAWAYNEFGSCNYNDTGGCGWYFSRNPGTYTLGPIGSPGATIPV